MKYKIPFNKPFTIGKEIEYIKESILRGHIAGNGIFTQRCQDFLEDKFHARKVFLTTSCTAALEMAAILCEISPGDEVILPSFTFVSTANAFYLRRAKLTFVDVSPDTLNIDETKIAKAITKRTKAIVPVHYAGVSCEMDKIIRLARDRNLFVIEDAAQGVNAKYKDKYLGTIGDIGAYSFHETKNYICGEGGAILLNNKKFIMRAEIIREKGTNRSQFFRGEVDKYTWVDIGSSYLPSDILAAFLYAQLENMNEIMRRRKEIYHAYYGAFKSLESQKKIRLPFVPPDRTTNYHMFYIILPSEEQRDDLLAYLKNYKIWGVFHYVPLHSSPVGRRFGYRRGDLPITEDLSGRLLRLPFYFTLSNEEQQYVIDKVTSFFK